MPIFDGELTIEILNSLAPRFSGELLRQAQTLAQAIEDDDYRAAAIAALAQVSASTLSKLTGKRLLAFHG